MQRNEFPEFARQIMALSELYKNPISEHLMEIYWNMLMCYDYEDFKRAIYQHGKNPDGGQFMPKPADLVRIIDGGGQAKAQLAWSKVYKAIAQIGSGQTVVFDDALIHAVIQDMEGWIKLCDIDDKALPFKAREFEQRYRAYLLNPPLSYPKQLSGTVEQHNSAHGHEAFIPKARLVGDTEKAQLVFEHGSEPEKCYQILGHLQLSSACLVLPSSVESADEIAAEALAEQVVGQDYAEPRKSSTLEVNP